MKNIMKLLTALLMLFSISLKAQNEHQDATPHSAEKEGGKHKIAIFTGFTHVSSAFYEHETHEESTGKWVPTIGIEYFYDLSEKFMVGAIIDMEFDNYMIKIHDESEIERANVFVTSLIGVYKITNHFGVFLGPGIETEFSQNSKNFFVLKVGAAYEIDISNGWEISPSISYDWKNEYATFSYGFGIGKRF